MKLRPLMTALLVALLISSVCTYLLSRKMTGHAAAPKIVETRCAAPSRPLQAGEALKAEDLELLPWPASMPLAGSFPTIADLVGRVVLYPLDKGEPILERDLATPGSVAGLSAKIPDGKRAIALRSDEVVGVGGFLIPGSHVDVLVIYHTDKLPEPVTATVLQDAVVLAAGQQIEPDPAGKATAVTVVTLLLTPEESERAFLASNQGAIHFVLRNAGDHSHSTIAPVSLAQLSAESVPTPPPTPAIAKPVARLALPKPGKPEQIETILGDGSTGDGGANGANMGGMGGKADVKSDAKSDTKTDGKPLAKQDGGI